MCPSFSLFQLCLVLFLLPWGLKAYLQGVPSKIAGVMPQQLVDFQGRSVGSQPREGYLGRRRATLLFSAAGDFEKELDRLYLNSEKIKCPFFRRRAFEFLEAAKKTLLFLAARHKSLPGGLFEP
ncbi:unnamed protein product, partial [Heterosigma akashiwo]